jgi:muramoyltetrapeptide carboxypeptidase
MKPHDVLPTVRSPRLRHGDRVRIVSPASPPARDGVVRGVEVLTSWGFQVELGNHVFDQWGYKPGRDEDRAADLNSAFRDPGVHAIITARGGKGAYRIIDDLDIDAVRRNPKPLVGFSDISHIQLALWARAGLAALHGPFANWNDDWTGPTSAEALRRALMTTDPVILHRDRNEMTAAVAVDGTATGILVGGNLDAIRTETGAGLPSLRARFSSSNTRRAPASGRSTARSPSSPVQERSTAYTASYTARSSDSSRPPMIRRSADGASPRSCVIA